VGNWIVGITTKTEKKAEINIIQQNQNPAHKTTGINTKTLRILHIICTLLAPSIRRNWNVQTGMIALKHEETTRFT
jgi:hypothetical protein